MKWTKTPKFKIKWSLDEPVDEVPDRSALLSLLEFNTKLEMARDMGMFHQGLELQNLLRSANTVEEVTSAFKTVILQKDRFEANINDGELIGLVRSKLHQLNVYDETIIDNLKAAHALL